MARGLDDGLRVCLLCLLCLAPCVRIYVCEPEHVSACMQDWMEYLARCLLAPTSYQEALKSEQGMLLREGVSDCHAGHRFRCMHGAGLLRCAVFGGGGGVWGAAIIKLQACDLARRVALLLTQEGL